MIKILQSLEEQKPQRGLKHISDSSSAFQARLEEQKPQRGLKHSRISDTIAVAVWKNRNPKGD